MRSAIQVAQLSDESCRSMRMATKAKRSRSASTTVDPPELRHELNAQIRRNEDKIFELRAENERLRVRAVAAGSIIKEPKRKAPLRTEKPRRRTSGIAPADQRRSKDQRFVYSSTGKTGPLKARHDPSVHMPDRYCPSCSALEANCRCA